MSMRRFNDLQLFFVSAEGATLSSEQDALDLLGEIYGSEADMLVVPASRFAPEFFDLSTKLAGHFFQKLQNYRMRLALVGDISPYLERSAPLRAFVSETNNIGYHLFAHDQQALEADLGRSR